MNNRDSRKEKNQYQFNCFLYFMDDRIHQYDSFQLYENRLKLFEELLEEWNLLSDEQRGKQEKNVEFDKKAEIAKAKKLLATYHQSNRQQPLLEQELKKREKSETKQIQTSPLQKSEDEKNENSEKEEIQVANARKSKQDSLHQFKKQNRSSDRQGRMKNKKVKEVTHHPVKRRLSHTKGQKQRLLEFCLQNLNHDNDFILHVLDKLEEQ